MEIKIILIGESGVGKTSIIDRYIKNTFNPGITSSTTMSYVGKLIEKNKKKIQLNIWDTIGQERFRSLSRLFFNDTKIVILVYSIERKESFENLDYWFNLYKEQLGEDTILGVVANKSDLFLDQEVPDEDGEKYAEKNGAIFTLLSAKENNMKIDQFINRLVDAYLNKINTNHNKINNDKIKLDNIEGNANNRKSSCCSGGSNKKRTKRYNSIVKKDNGFLQCVFLGHNGVGKTSIIKRIKGDEFDEDEEHTDSINEVVIKYNNNSIKLKLKIYDVDNDKKKTNKFVEILKKSYIFFLVYDINNQESLENINYWIEVIQRCKEDDELTYLLYIIGNKNDLLKDEDKKVDNNEIIENNDIQNKNSIEEGKKISIKYKGTFKVVSAKENKGIQNITNEAVENYLSLS